MSRVRRTAAVTSLALALAAPAAHAQSSIAVDTFHPGHAVSPTLFGQFFEEINFGGVGGLYAELIRNRTFMDPATPARWIGPGEIARVPGKLGSAVQLNGTSPNRDVQLPAGIVSSLHDFTIATWVNPAATPTWSRVFDFGSSQDVNMFLTVNAGATPRFAITVSGNGAEQRLNAPSALPLNTWTHLAVTLQGTTATLYVNGVAVDTNANMTLNPASMGVTTNNWIGRSQYDADPLLNATVDDFQIYDRALSAAEVQALTTAPGAGNVASYKFDEPGGATAVDSSGNSRNGTIALDDGQWSVVEDGGGSVAPSLDASAPLNAALPRSLKLEVGSDAAGQRVGMANAGYFGIPVVPGQTYQASFFAKASAGFNGPLTLSLESSSGATTYASATVGGLTSDWRRYNATLTVPAGGLPSSANRFVVAIPGPAPAGTDVWLQVVSLFPPTYAGERNGLRPDLVDELKAMHPTFLRFPGGNYVEGNYAPGDPWGTRFDWKKTIGPVEDRPGHENAAWNYWSDDGLGLFEYLRLAEDLHATPVIGVFAGMSLGGSGSQNIVPQDQLAPYVQDALDEIEYAIGPVSSKYGAMRAADGHPAPFPTPYVEIGNEDNLNRGAASYDAYRYPMFYDAIKAAYPQVTTIATTPVTSRPMEVIDEHYYSSPSFFEQQATRYDSYSRSGPKVFVGEYAARTGATGLPTGLLGDSIGEAAFMTGLERNSDVVTMASYAPLFAYVGHTQWNPDLIGFDQQHVVGSTSYYVQKLFASHLGDHVLPVSSSDASLFASSTVDSATGKVYTKVVNPASSAKPVTLSFTGRNASEATAEVLGDPDPNAGNTLATPTRVTPKTVSLSGSGGSFAYTAPANSLTVITLTPEAQATTTVTGSVPATLSLSLGGPASFGEFVPGVDRTYAASTTADVVSTAGDASLSVSDPGHLANGAFSLPDPLQVTFSKSSWTAPVSHDGVTIGFSQHIGANDALRTGSYAKTLTFTLSTTSP